MAPVFLCRPAAAAREASAASLRVRVTFDLDGHLLRHAVKRKGSLHEDVIRLCSVPDGLDTVLTPRLEQPTSLMPSPLQTANAVDCAVARHDAFGQVDAH